MVRRALPASGMNQRMMAKQKADGGSASGRASDRRVQMSRIAFVTGALATLAFAGSATAAAPVCSARNDILTKLANTYHEQPASVALTSDGHLLEVLKSDNAKTWSILITA